MKIIKFRIKNYKSIIDSKDCYPAEMVTILAGKNEAGKSSILEALSDFNYGTTINSTAIPITYPEKIPSITIFFEIKKSIFEEIYNQHKINEKLKHLLTNNFKDKTIIGITKSYPEEYKISEDIFTQINEKIKSQIKEIADEISIRITATNTESKNILKKLSSTIKITDDKPTIEEKLSTLKLELKELTSDLSESQRNEFINLIKLIESYAQQLSNTQTHLPNIIENYLIKKLPNIILFNSFEDIFPNEINLSEAESNIWISDLKNISDLNIEIIKSKNTSIKKQHKHKLNLQLNKDFSQFWSQDLSKLSIDWEGDTIHFWIEENGIFYEPKMRSQGRRWHLAFYIKVSSRSKANENNILLIDEPGLYLHATAQRDIIRHLEASSNNQQIIISTHSPYLIDPDKLDRLRLVLKNDTDGTYVENKIHAVSDKETLTPILTTIGLELNQGITSTDRRNNVIVEGPSDYFYLNAIRDQIEYKNINFISGGGAGNMAKVGTILQGWGCKVLYLFDDDNAYKTAQRNIKNEWVTISKEWLSSLGIEGSIEDIFTKEEFAKIINSVPENITTTNSTHMKLQKLDKVLPSRNYLDTVRKNNAPTLSTETKEKAKIIFDNLQSKFEAYKY